LTKLSYFIPICLFYTTMLAMSTALKFLFIHPPSHNRSRDFQSRYGPCAIGPSWPPGREDRDYSNIYPPTQANMPQVEI
jgi:hypothetical protein